MRSKLAIALVVLLALGALSLPLGGRAASAGAPGKALDLSMFSDAPPTHAVELLFIHHSCGGQWLADRGAEDGVRAPCITAHHPNGGELRARLRANNYVVHEASYGSEIGEHTDLFDWLPKFKGKMDKVLAVDENDRFTANNRVVVFKSCFPNSDFVGRGAEPGKPSGPELTLANARATMNALLRELAKRPDVLFVYVTAPPIAREDRAPAWKYALRSAKRKIDKRLTPDESGALAREFNDWVKSPDGWLAGYALANVVVFDLFDVLTAHGESNVLAYSSAEGDSHSTSTGNLKASEAFIPLLNRAMHRMEESR